MTPGGPQKSRWGALFLGGTSWKYKPISTFHAGEGRMGCTETSDVIREVRWNGDDGLGIKNRLGRPAEMSGQRVKVHNYSLSRVSQGGYPP